MSETGVLAGEYPHQSKNGAFDRKNVIGKQHPILRHGGGDLQCQLDHTEWGPQDSVQLPCKWFIYGLW